MNDLAVLAAVLVVVAAFRVRLSTLPITTPMIFLGAGILLGPDVLDLFRLDVDSESVSLLAELTLSLLLFADASRIDVRRLRASIGIPARLLGIGLPLTIAMGTAVTALLLTDLTWAEAALVAAILAPTDAALGEAVVTNEAVPLRIRQALNVESGLNDGLAVPAVAIFLALAANAEIESPLSQLREALSEIGIGIGTGAATAAALAALVGFVGARGWTDSEGYRLMTAGAAFVAFATATALEGNGFIAAFVAGLVVRSFVGDSVDAHAELTEDAGQIGAAATFVVFGALLVIPAFDALTIPVALCALGTLTLGRMLPVWIALLGTQLRLPSVAFIGWFGPRGLASMVFGLLLFQEDGLDAPGDLFSVVVIVIVTSVVLHGATASPLATRYGAWAAANEDRDMEEMRHVDNPMHRGDRRRPTRVSDPSTPPPST